MTLRSSSWVCWLISGLICPSCQASISHLWLLSGLVIGMITVLVSKTTLGTGICTLYRSLIACSISASSSSGIASHAALIASRLRGFWPEALNSAISAKSLMFWLLTG